MAYQKINFLWFPKLSLRPVLHRLLSAYPIKDITAFLDLMTSLDSMFLSTDLGEEKKITIFEYSRFETLIFIGIIFHFLTLNFDHLRPLINISLHVISICCITYVMDNAIIRLHPGGINISIWLNYKYRRLLKVNL